LSNDYEDFINYLDILTFEEFYNNQVSHDLTIYGDKKVKKGTKVIKSFKYFIGDGELLANIQNRASMIIQEDKIEGYLCMSVHPLDYLSSSENTYNWRSCHSLDGEYRAGNLSYMMDGSTVVCYLEADDKAVLPRFPISVPWNNKKWRCLLHFDTTLEVVFAGRQYPMSSPSALGYIRDIFFEGPLELEFNTRFPNPAPYCKCPKTWSDWSNWYVETGEKDTMLWDKYVNIGFKLYGIYDMIKDVEGSKHFNDLLKSSVYEHPYYMSKLQAFKRTPRFFLGAAVPCLECGMNHVEQYDTVKCIECNDDDFDEELYVYCECCQSRIYRDDAIWVYDTVVCEDCAERETFVCPTCGERHYNYNQRWDGDLEDYICQWCYNARREKEGE
jgi:hypothetical protein